MDHDRLNTVLSSRRIFGLVPDADLRDIKSCFRRIVSGRVQDLLVRLDDEAQALGIGSSDLGRKHVRLNNLKTESDRLQSELQLIDSGKD